MINNSNLLNCNLSEITIDYHKRMNKIDKRNKIQQKSVNEALKMSLSLIEDS